MIELDATSFTSVKEFPLRRRWTDPRWALLPAEDLGAIRPLTPAAAAELEPLATSRCNEHRLAVDAVRLGAEADDEDAVRRRLQELAIPEQTEVLVSWDAAMAVVTSWRVFVRYWGDFCYPSSDDVTIMPLDETWTLCYFHYELFVFEHVRRSGR